MTTDFNGSVKKTKAVSGTVSADIQKFGRFEGEVTTFVTLGEVVFLRAKHYLDETKTKWNQINFEFPTNIENKRHEFYKNGPLAPPSFGEVWNNGDAFRPHTSIVDAGHIEINFDFDKGTLDASFNFTFEENPTQERRQVVGLIKDTQGLEHRKINVEDGIPDKSSKVVIH